MTGCITRQAGRMDGYRVVAVHPVQTQSSPNQISPNLISSLVVNSYYEIVSDRR